MSDATELPNSSTGGSRTSALELLLFLCKGVSDNGPVSKMFFSGVAVILLTAYLHHSCGGNIYLCERFDISMPLLYAIILCHNLSIILCAF